MAVTVEEIAVPASVDGSDADDFAEYVRLRNAVEAEVLGTELLSPTARQLRPSFADNPDRIRRLFIARLDGVPVGRGMTTVRPRDLAAGAHLAADVLPARRRTGIGSALFDTVARAADEAGCVRLLVNTPHRAIAGGDRIASSTGAGDVPALDPGARFLAARGFGLEQVVRISMWATAGLDRLHAPSALAAVEGSYRIHVWHGVTPAPWLVDLALLRTRMSTDAPSGGLEARIDRWDPDRVVAHDRRVEDGGQVAVTAAAEHLQSGHLAGFTELVVPHEGVVAAQEDTLVLAAHRGHGLGLLLKAAAARAALSVHPRIEQIVTYNAEENRPMLAVNDQLGFRAVGCEGTWQRHG